MCYLGNYPERYSKLLLDTYSESVIEKINMPDIITILKEITF
jgi:hypothetical protein